MPYKEIEVPAEVFLTMNDINIYYSYRDDKFGYRKEGEDVYSFSGYEVDEFDVTELPLYNGWIEGTYEWDEDYHRHLIIASYALGDLVFASEELPPFKYADKFVNYTADDLGKKVKAIVSLESDGEWIFSEKGYVGELENIQYRYLTLRNVEDEEDMLKFPVKDDVDIQQFLEILFLNSRRDNS
ncbi:hypothetical protein UP12_19555 (plasmid) [Bacillus pumilus]|uniref:hypothetical protein n=1 Tax=Bacillus pumilus TaxID=1408 RepID=UPI0007760076|nr:hypothetical protein [Bacillus pumilus]AMM99602.1 hypothetical protein UP12_19555 [Bacillus pumilus]